jgi:hypothetical protein
MREYCTYGSARGAIGNCRPYRNYIIMGAEDGTEKNKKEPEVTAVSDAL